MRKTLNILFASVGWFAVITQFVLMFENRSTSIIEMTIRFFSFFTILTNTLVSVYFTYQIFDAKRIKKNILQTDGTLTAITGYITVVGLVYQVALRHIWNPTGMQMIVDELLHTLIPVLVIIYWFLYEKKSAVKWKTIPKFLIYPLVYLLFIIARGAVSEFYPYPFIHVTELGWPQTLINIMVLFAVFLVLFVLFIGLGKLLAKKED